MKVTYCISVYTDPQQLKRLVNSLHPDAYIHTIAFNSAFAASCTLITSAYSGLASLTPSHYINGCHINVLCEEDSEKLVA